MTDTLPSHARVVVIGGGVVGLSVAYHLAALGCRDVVLLERSKIGSGTSWHAAGNMETYRADPLIGEMIRYAVEFYPKLEAETGQALGWRQTGRVMFTHIPERMAQYRGLPALGRARGLEIGLLSPRGVVEKLPIANEAGILGGAWIPSDGRINPTDLAVALSRGARMRGARIAEDAPVLLMTTKAGRINSVVTAQGEVKCEAIVIAAGLWSPRLGDMIGVKIPLHAVQHLYILTKPLEIVTRDMPLFITYDERMYGREDVGGLLVGFFDSKAIPISPAELPKDFSFGLLDSNWNQIEPNMAVALERFPVLNKAEIRLLLNGPESFTPDMQMLLGETPGLQGCFVATGMNSSGIALSAAAGKLTAEWILKGRPSLDVTRLDIRRFAENQGVTGYLRDRASEVVTHMCRVPTPDLDFNDTRMIRRSPLHQALADRGARFVSVLGWERPIWFGPGSEDDKDWAKSVGPEILAAENGVALFDRSSDAKLRLEGARAGALLRHLTGSLTDLPIGGVVAAPMLNRRGGVEVMAAIARLGETSWLLLTEPEQSTRLRSWVERHRPASGTNLVDVTSAWAAIALVGPRAEALLASLCRELPADKGTIRQIEIAYAPGMLVPWLRPVGIYLMLPTDFALHVHERLVAAGGAFGLKHAGSLAAEGLAVEHFIRRFGTELSPNIAAVSASIDRLLDVDRNRSFIGRTAVLAARAKPPRKEIRAFRLDGTEPMQFANAPILGGKRLVGHVTSGAYFPSLRAAVLLGLVDRLEEGRAYRLVLRGQELPLAPYAERAPTA
jgi:glycine/D-amino acid oxidase-like deaminating enzyme/glycine cleavage system aminomethyltransferase T